METKSNNSRNWILNKIRNGEKIHTDFSFPEPDWDKNIYKEIEGSLEECFAEELSAINGNCVLCDSENDVFEKIKRLLSEKKIERLFCKTKDIAEKLEEHNISFFDGQAEFYEMEAGITFCEALVARTGSVMVSAASESGRQMNIFPPVHIVVATKAQLVPYVGDALWLMKEKYGENLPSAITNITGPSRTADIEKTLVLGAHGPKEFWVFIY